MAGQRKSKLKWLFIGVLAGMILAPIYVYFSHDVSLLKDQYPHPIPKELEMDYEVRPGRPKSWVKLAEISKAGKWAIVLSEDWAFYEHEGVDVEQLKIAVKDMMKEKRFRGASTISQQMVKNVYLSNSRTLWRKLNEYALTYKAEKALEKQRILEIYLNVIEFGPGIYGIRKASNHYFNKHPSALTPREAAFLAMLLPSPKKYYVSFKRKELTKFALARIKGILTKLRMAHVISPEEYQAQLYSRFNWEPYVAPVEPVVEPEGVIEIEDETVELEEVKPEAETEEN